MTRLEKLGMTGLAAALAIGAMVSGKALAQDTLERIRQQGRVAIAVADEQPYGYRNAEGDIVGEAPDIAREILSRIDPAIEIEWTVTEFGQLIPGLQAGEFDIAAAGMFITPERCEQVAFSNPTYVVGEAFVVREGNPLNLTDYWSIAENEQARVALLSGTVEYNYAVVTGIPAERGLIYFTFREAAEALLAGEVDAVGATALTARDLAEDYDGLAATTQFYPELDGEEVKGYGGFTFRREDTALVEAFNRELADFLGSEEHLALIEPYGFGADMLPDRTTTELCRQ